MRVNLECLGVRSSWPRELDRMVAVVFCLFVSLASPVAAQSVAYTRIVGQVNLPAAHWVYHYPHWYLWRHRGP